MSGDTINVQGIVTHVAHGCVKVQCAFGGKTHEVLCTRSGRLKQYRIHLIPGDDVDVEIGAYDLGRGRITFRHGKRERTA